MSMAAAARGVWGGPPRPPRPPRPPGGGWPLIAPATPSAGAAIQSEQLFDRLTRIGAPSESIRFPVQSLQCAPMVRNRARWIHCDHDLVADLQRVAFDASLAQLSRTTPFQRPPLHHSSIVRRLDLQVRMRIPEQQVEDLPFQLNFLIRVVGRRQGVVGIRAHTAYDCPGNDKKDLASHEFLRAPNAFD